MSNRPNPNNRRTTDTTHGNSQADSRSVGDPEFDGPAQETDTESPLTSRRQLLTSLSVAPVAMALSGCQTNLPTSDRSALPDIAPGDSIAVKDAIRFAESYAMALTVRSQSGREKTVTGRFHGADHYVRTTSGDVETESYMIDGTGYLFVDGECIEYPELHSAVDGIVGVSDERLTRTGATELGVTGVETIDDRSVYRLERTGSEETDEIGPVTYFVDGETRFLRRIDRGRTRVDFHSWGEVDPIIPPESNCSPSP